MTTNRLYYVWTEGHGGATGESPSGPVRHGPFLAASKPEAAAKMEEHRTSWDGPIKKITTDGNYRPLRAYIW